ncbi:MULTISPECIES: dephospho-CoA kinase [unclassified Legionella]|uniref:dephospho-CoA kinase n=1 Tax=unclassified Legionella TaxID=2622702 RepID=UPI00105655FB|nr:MULTISPECIES: dephospho-CoA kinase [unclassified Legionella]MDI9818808.1 dephospho-CoA kinase [Legionella sp. PL877]
MYCVGLTGSIASGKSTIASFFKGHGITVISADEIARELTSPQQPAYYKIKNHFGNTVITSSDKLNRSALRQIIFNNPGERLWLEQLLHPMIRQRILDKVKQSQTPYTVVEIPLLNNRQDYPYLARVLLITAEREQKIRRVMERDKIPREQAIAILATQYEDIKRQHFADDIITNNGSLAELIEKIEKLHKQYLRLARKNNDS